MPSRMPFRLRKASSICRARPCLVRQRRWATTATSITPAPAIDQGFSSTPPVSRFPSTQPPSHKPPEFRKSQLHRQYTSLLRSTPLTLLFQHNNLRSTEWMSVRRELAHALRKVDEAGAPEAAHGEAAGSATAGAAAMADGIKLQIIQAGIFAAALRVVEYYRPEDGRPLETHETHAATPSSAATKPNSHGRHDESVFTHGLSRAAHEAVASKKVAHALTPLLSGPLAVLTFPAVSPAHLKAALSILAPRAPAFPAPSRRSSPAYHEPAVQSGVQKLMLLGARIEGTVFDGEGARWVGGIDGGLDGLRAQLAAILQGVGASLASTLDSAGNSLYFTLEGRRVMLEDDAQEAPGLEATDETRS